MSTFRRLPRRRPVARATRPRHVKGRMNQLETRYSLRLAALMQAGEITGFKFEALTFRIATKTTYTPDFLVTLPNGELEIHEVKGHWEEDARVKIKTAAVLFPFRFIGVTEPRRHQFTFEEFPDQ